MTYRTNTPTINHQTQTFSEKSATDEKKKRSQFLDQARITERSPTQREKKNHVDFANQTYTHIGTNREEPIR